MLNHSGAACGCFGSVILGPVLLFTSIHWPSCRLRLLLLGGRWEYIYLACPRAARECRVVNLPVSHVRIFLFLSPKTNIVSSFCGLSPLYYHIYISSLIPGSSPDNSRGRSPCVHSLFKSSRGHHSRASSPPALHFPTNADQDLRPPRF